MADEDTLPNGTQDELTAEKVELVDRNDNSDKEMGKGDRKLSEEENGSMLAMGMAAKMTSFGIYKNLLILSFAFVLLFSSLMSFSNIQSTVNIEEGLGTTGLAVLYATMVLTNLFVTLITLPLLSYKVMMFVSMAPYILYVATGFYSSWYTVLPASVAIGFGKSFYISVMWCLTREIGVIIWLVGWFAGRECV